MLFSNLPPQLFTFSNQAQSFPAFLKHHTTLDYLSLELILTFLALVVGEEEVTVAAAAETAARVVPDNHVITLSTRHQYNSHIRVRY